MRPDGSECEIGWFEDSEQKRGLFDSFMQFLYLSSFVSWLYNAPAEPWRYLSISETYGGHLSAWRGLF